MITVANYEYIFAYKFDQAAALHLETRATGIVSTHAMMPGETSPYGALVNPGVYAPNHQHLFSLRIDPAIDGELLEPSILLRCHSSIVSAHRSQ
jgi:primary-amine oxidase